MMIEKVLCKSVFFTLTLETCAFDFDFDELLKAEREVKTFDLKSAENIKETLNMWKAFMISDWLLSLDASLFRH